MPANSIKRPTRRVMPVLPPDEARRLATLYFLDILDSPPQEQFDRIARMAQRLFTVPMAAISFVDAERDWFKSRSGPDFLKLPRDLSCGSHTILSRETFIVEDATID